MNKIRTAIVIPARLESTRFPNKLLSDMEGMTLIERVYETCEKTGLPVYVATDSEDIADLFPFNVIVTFSKCRNGTERVAAAATQLGYDRYINVQGDMIGATVPMIMDHAESPILERVNTTVTELFKVDIADPNTVKVIKTSEHAHWFTRQPMPYADKHLGIYSYSSNLLKRYAEVIDETTGEVAEKLEQLRWLQSINEPIYLKYHKRVHNRIYSIDTPDDLIKWNNR